MNDIAAYLGDSTCDAINWLEIGLLNSSCSTALGVANIGYLIITALAIAVLAFCLRTLQPR